jgi:hypothetical protein
MKTVTTSSRRSAVRALLIVLRENAHINPGIVACGATQRLWDSDLWFSFLSLKCKRQRCLTTDENYLMCWGMSRDGRRMLVSGAMDAERRQRRNVWGLS